MSPTHCPPGASDSQGKEKRGVVQTHLDSKLWEQQYRKQEHKGPQEFTMARVGFREGAQRRERQSGHIIFLGRRTVPGQWEPPRGIKQERDMTRFGVKKVTE
jgi:hypothetical protein